MVELSLLVKATLILAAALVAARAAGRARASVRALLLASAFGVLLLLPVAAAVIPPRAVHVPAAAIDLSALVMEPAALDVTPIASPAVVQNADAGPRVALPSAMTMARIAWTAGALTFVAPMLVALWRLRRLRRDALPWLGGRALVADAARQAGVTRLVDVFLHEALAAPMTCGLFRPAVGLPIDAPTWTETELRHALVHEMEHVRRYDWPVHLIARMVCALYWFHPLAWVAWRQLCLESERACDDAVLRGTDGTVYAEQLVMLARRISKHSPVPMLSMADRSNLATRVSAVLDGRVARGRTGKMTTAAVVLAAATVTCGISPLEAVNPAPQAGAAAPASARAFAVASIKPNTSGTLGQTITQNGNTFIGRNVTLGDLVAHAYGLRNADQLSGGPDWIDTDRYDVEAKPEGAASWDETMLMVRTLLADRFQLRLRREMRDTPSYALVVSRNGARVRTAADPDCPAPPSAACGGFSTRPGRFVGRRVTLAQVAALLSSRSGRQVLDRTEMRGFFDVELEWALEPVQRPQPGSLEAPAADPPAVALFTAIEEQLGLRLQPITAPMEHFIIEAARRPTPNDAPAAPAPAPTPLAFEVASIRRNTSNVPLFASPRLQPGGRMVAINVPLHLLMRVAYNLEDNQIVGGPGWMTETTFDLTAQAAPTTTMEEARAMLRALLVERFHLATHTEQRQLPVYVLSRASADALGPQLRRAGAACAPPRTSGALAGGPADGPGGPPPPPGGAPLGAPGAASGCRSTLAPGQLSAREYTMNALAGYLSGVVDRPVIDRTGLEGTFDVDLSYTVMDPAAAGDPPPASTEPSIFAALREQLRLRLDADRAPIDVMVIDRAEPPTAN